MPPEMFILYDGRMAVIPMREHKESNRNRSGNER